MPRLPDDIDLSQLAPGVRAELTGMRDELATTIAKYLLAAETAEDPELAWAYAQAARGMAGRIGIIREVTGVAAYRAGKWAEALAELRAARRLTGRRDYLPLMADAERALGRLDRALELVHSDEAKQLTRGGQVELRIVESGIRRDQGRPEAAVLALQIPELTDTRVHSWSARLLFAYAEALFDAGRPEQARAALERAAAADPDDETGAADRLDELDGVSLADLAED